MESDLHSVLGRFLTKDERATLRVVNPDVKPVKLFVPNDQLAQHMPTAPTLTFFDAANEPLSQGFVFRGLHVRPLLLLIKEEADLPPGENGRH